MKVLIEVPKDKVQKMLMKSYHYGWLREAPNRKWTEREQKEAIRYAIEHMIEDS